MTLGPQWAWKPNDKLKSLKECLDLLVTNAGYDGNFMLNVGPMPTGEIEPRQVERLREIGRWMRPYGETHLRHPRRTVSARVVGRLHVQGRPIFVHVLHDRSTGCWNLPPLPKKIVASRLLGGGEVEVKQTHDGVSIRIPPAARQELDTIVELRLDGSATAIRPLAE